MKYTETEAVYDIMVWQLPVPFVLAACFVVAVLTGPNGQHMPVWTYPLMFMSSSVFVSAVLFIFDLLLLPPVFALIRFWHATYFLY
jgi:hypothetical protein